jgi:hypothetical protein
MDFQSLSFLTYNLRNCLLIDVSLFLLVQPLPLLVYSMLSLLGV